MEPGFYWLLIPLVALLMRGFRDWVRFKATQRELGSSTVELERQVNELKRINAGLGDRLQNLEAIVVSQTWNALNDPGLSTAERELKVASAARRELRDDTAAANQQRAEQLARRLQG